MGMPCGKYVAVMHELWLPLLADAGNLDKPTSTRLRIRLLQRH
jgi:hypothetical protein